MTKVALIGAGPMAQAYGQVLKALMIDCLVIGRGQKSADEFTSAVGLPVLTGSLEANMPALVGVTHAIVALPVPVLATQSMALMDAGIRNLLVEKPAGIDVSEIEFVARRAGATNSQVFVAYNRRFYASVLEAKRRIASDGGPTSFRFEMSEWSARIGQSAQSDTVKSAWYLANSSHVVDMAFYLGGFPKTLQVQSSGSTGWHEPAIFVGHGEAVTGALFSYHADWNAAPRWMVEICTSGHTYMFQPLEGLRVRTKEGFAILDIDCPGAEDDTMFKPGLKRQVEAFLLKEPTPDLLNIQDQLSHARDIYAIMTS